MRAVALTTFLADAERRARETGVADIPVDTLRNGGGQRTEHKRMLLDRAAARSGCQASSVISYY